MNWSRRRFLENATLCTLPWLCQIQPVAGQANKFSPQAPSASERTEIVNVLRRFMHKFDVPGLSIAFGYGGSIIYEEVQGWATRNEPLTTKHRFRIASVTKPITSAAIFTLIENGRLQLTDRVFGSGGILGDDFGSTSLLNYVNDITVEHLLTHTAGGWSNDDSDPMFRNPAMNHAQLIAWTLRTMPLQHNPGTTYAYSNFGYCLLGRVIEKLNQCSYADYTKRAVLSPCHINNMQIAGNRLKDRQPDEVCYYAMPGEDPYSLNVTRMDSHGGWIATPSSLVLFAMSLGHPLLRDEISVITKASRVNAGYAKGWCVNSAGNWWHMGSLDGSSTELVRARNGLCWSILTNTRRKNMDDDLDQLGWQVVEQVKAWQEIS